MMTQRAGSRERMEAQEAGDACAHLEDSVTVERELTQHCKHFILLGIAAFQLTNQPVKQFLLAIVKT